MELFNTIIGMRLRDLDLVFAPYGERADAGSGRTSVDPFVFPILSACSLGSPGYEELNLVEGGGPIGLVGQGE